MKITKKTRIKKSTININFYFFNAEWITTTYL